MDRVLNTLALGTECDRVEDSMHFDPGLERSRSSPEMKCIEELFVELEEVFHAGAVAGERVLAVATVPGAGEFGMGFGQLVEIQAHFS